MNNLKRLLTQPLRAVPNSLIIFFLIITIVGFADASYLTIEHYKNVIPPCSVTGGCERVLTSAYSTILGVPVSLVGAIYYLLILVGTFAYLEGKREKILRYSLAITFFGFLASLYFLFLQMFVIHSYCAYCLGSAATSTALFIVAAYVFKKYSASNLNESVANINN